MTTDNFTPTKKNNRSFWNTSLDSQFNETDRPLFEKKYISKYLQVYTI